MATLNIAPATDLTPTLERAADCVAYANHPAVLGKPDPVRPIYYVTLVKPGDPIMRFKYISKADAVAIPGVVVGAHPIPDEAHEHRPDCTCKDFQMRALDTDGKWLVPNICKHIFARLLVILNDVQTTPADRKAWLAVATAALARVEVNSPEGAKFIKLLMLNAKLVDGNDGAAN